MQKRFFVVVFAPNAGSLQKLNQSGLDLFNHTARKSGREGYAIDGLLNLEEIGSLVEGGCRVLVNEDAAKKTAVSKQVISFEEFLQMMKEEG